MSFSQRHYRLVSPTPDTVEDVRQRLIRRTAAERAVADRLERFPTLTPFNAAEAIRYQDERIKHHERAMGAR